MRLADIRQLDINKQWAIYWYLRGRRPQRALYGLPALAAALLIATLVVWFRNPLIGQFFGAAMTLDFSLLDQVIGLPLALLIALAALTLYFANAAELNWRQEMDAVRTLKERTGLRPDNIDPDELGNFQPEALEPLSTLPSRKTAYRRTLR